ncbi:MAG: hypothetical protein MK132_12815 [Lentisphaerales bacterium]|nr:hypothetical protein [Lentisphaerales bacterium]
MKSFFRVLLSLPVYMLGFLMVHAVLKLNYGAHQEITYSLLGGLVAGIIIFSFVCHFKRFYIFGHELAHWIFAKLFMKETKNFKVGKDGGAVQVKDPNVWVVLAPYFYPTFTIMWLPFWFLFSHFQKEIQYSFQIFFVMLGMSWAYHLVLTLYALKFEQSDIEKYGRPLSFSIIFLFNMLFIYFFLICVTDGLKAGIYILWCTISHDIVYLATLVQSGAEKLSMFISSLN